MSASQNTNAQQGLREKKVVLTDEVTGYPVAIKYVAPDGVDEIAIL
ncbi:MAG: hypothetical protein WC499_01845 [Patescibacteria group bacterium]